MRIEEVAYVSYRNVKISNVSYKNVCNSVRNVIENDQRGYICLTDVSNLMVAAKNKQLQEAINASLFSLADGTPLAWYARMVGCKEIERISGASLMSRLFADMIDCKHYLLGDTEQTISKVIAEAKKINKNIKISGHSPPFKEFDDKDNLEMLDKIREAEPDIIWVSFGGWKQEKWMNQNISNIDKGVMIGVGAAFKFLIGDIVTPPQIFQIMGLQWLFRLTQHLLRDPKDCLKTLREREILVSKKEFLLGLPHEINLARRQLKLLTGMKNPTQH